MGALGDVQTLACAVEGLESERLERKRKKHIVVELARLISGRDFRAGSSRHEATRQMFQSYSGVHQQNALTLCSISINAKIQS